MGQRGRKLEKRLERVSLMLFGHCMLLYLQQYLIYYKSGCGRRQIAEPPKIMCSVSCSILSSNSLQWTENLRAVRFDAVPL
jgi:hypothetical protein